MSSLTLAVVPVALFTVDMINMIKLDYQPSTVEWIELKGHGKHLLAWYGAADGAAECHCVCVCAWRVSCS